MKNLVITFMSVGFICCSSFECSDDDGKLPQFKFSEESIIPAPKFFY